MANKYNNRNENLINLEEIEEINLLYSNFEYKKYFRFLCNIKPNKKNEKLEINSQVNEEHFNVDKRKGLVYIFVYNNKILKIWKSETTFKWRVESYNTWKTKYRISWKNSTTNWFCLQSFILIDKEIEVYVYFPIKEIAEIFWIEREVEPNPKHWEKEILTKLEKQNKKPIFCTQT